MSISLPLVSFEFVRIGTVINLDYSFPVSKLPQPEVKKHNSVCFETLKVSEVTLNYFNAKSKEFNKLIVATLEALVLTKPTDARTNKDRLIYLLMAKSILIDIFKCRRVTDSTNWASIYRPCVSSQLWSPFGAQKCCFSHQHTAQKHSHKKLIPQWRL